MLPKPEKIKKTPNPEQLDLVDSLSVEKKLQHKRRFVILSLFLTIGLSLCFWIYRDINTAITNKSWTKLKPDFSSLSFNLPQFKTNKNSIPLDVEKVLGKDSNNWFIYIEAVPSVGNPYIWSYHPENVFAADSINGIKNEISLVNVSEKSSISSVLPQGVQVRETHRSFNSQSIYIYQISIPKKQIYLVYSSKNPQSDSFEKNIQKITEKVYWNLMEMD